MSFKTVLLQEKNSFKVCAFQHIPDVFAITLFSSTFFNNRQFSNAPFIQQRKEVTGNIQHIRWSFSSASQCFLTKKLHMKRRRNL